MYVETFYGRHKIKDVFYLSYQRDALLRHWSDYAEAQAYLSLRWAHILFCKKCCALSDI